MTERRPTAVVTGANSGVGLEVTRRLADAGWRVVMVCRSRERAAAALEELRSATGSESLDIVLADLADLDTVESAAGRIRDGVAALDALVLNAGLYAPELRRTSAGFEETMGVNHLAHVLLTLRLGDLLVPAGGRVVAVASEGHRHAKLERSSLEAVFDGSAWRNGLTAYADSKLANVLFAFELDRRLGPVGVRADAVHPGVLATRIWERTRGFARILTRIGTLFMAKADEGGEAVARLLLDPGAGAGGGRYFDGTERTEASEAARDEQLAARLWTASLEALDLVEPRWVGPSGKGGGGRATGSS